MQEPDNFLPPLYDTVLSNGMRVLGLEYRRTPWVNLIFLAKRGAEADPPGKGGTADCLAEFLTLGTQKRDQLQLALDIEGRGATLKAQASWDHTVIAIEGLAEDFRELLALLAEVVTQPGFPEEEFALLQQRRQAELIHMLDDPRELANRTFLPLFFGASPYGHPPDGSPESLAALSLGDLQAFYQQQFHPQASALVVVGMVAALEVQETAAALLGSWRTSREPSLPYTEVKPEELAAPGLYLLDRPQLTQSEIRCGHLGIPRRHPDYFPLRLLNYILGGGGFSSRLMMRVRAEKGLTYGIRSQFHCRRAPGPFLISTFTPAEQTAVMLQEIIQVMGETQSQGVTEAELAEAQSYHIGNFPLGLETPSSLARHLVNIELYELGLDYLQQYRRRIREVELVAVNRCAREYLHPQELVTLVVGPASLCLPELEKLGPVNILPAD